MDKEDYSLDIDPEYLLEDILEEEYEQEEIKPEKKEKRKIGNYVDNEKFIEEFLKWKEQCKTAEKLGKPEPKIPDYIGYAIIEISKGISRMRNRKTGRCCFINYSFVEEMISEGIEHGFKYLKNFDPEKSRNPHAFFSMIIYHTFLRYIQYEKKNQYVKYKLTEMSNILDDGELLELEDGTKINLEPYSNLSEFIEKFENDMKQKKENIKKKKLEKISLEGLF